MKTSINHSNKSRSRWPDRIALLIIAILVSFVIYPVWVSYHPDTRTRGVVVDEANRPLPYVTLRVRDAEGRDLGTATTDAKGEFLWRQLWGTQGTFTSATTTFGEFGATKYLHSTGGRDHVLLSRLVEHKVRVKNAVSGLPQAGLSLEIIPEPQTFSVWRGGFMERETNQAGETDIGVFPVTVRMHVQSDETNFVISSITPSVATDCRTTPCQMSVL